MGFIRFYWPLPVQTDPQTSWCCGTRWSPDAVISFLEMGGTISQSVSERWPAQIWREHQQPGTWADPVLRIAKFYLWKWVLTVEIESGNHMAVAKTGGRLLCSKSFDLAMSGTLRYLVAFPLWSWDGAESGTSLHEKPSSVPLLKSIFCLEHPILVRKFQPWGTWHTPLPWRRPKLNITSTCCEILQIWKNMTKRLLLFTD